ncbi:hypothetical protein EJ07DRAFT_97682 [Lizonia empirigonia]|nr:hypothetical protein EJ07DRAFT_97682 [Lizonia empirigonia]
MNPWRNSALQNAKLQAILSSYRRTRSHPRQEDSEQDMPAPPAYHMVVDPEAPTPDMSSPYDLDDEERSESSEDEEIPEVTINAATQIRGNGNIISTAQMDSVRIATLVATILSDESVQADAATAPQAPVTNLHSSRTERRKKGCINVNITVNCGATIIGDRNIVGPGLGDIARQMQIAQRNAALQAQQQHQQTQALQQRKLAQGLAQAQAQKQAQAGLAGVGHVTPPMSRSASLGSEGTPKAKRKAEDDAGEGLLLLKRRC